MIVVTGGTGFLGRHLVSDLANGGVECLVISRSGRDPWGHPRVSVLAADPGTPGPWQGSLSGADAVVNLNGVALVEPRHRWTAARKAVLRASRIDTTRQLASAIRAATSPPRVFLSASAVGFYGDGGDRMLDESSPAGTDFLAHLCRDWEAAALDAADATRVVLLRTGLVLGRSGGVLSPLLPLFRLGVGGPWGSGGQWWPWIHVADHVGLVRFAMRHSEVTGPLNLAAPNPVRVAEFAHELGRVLGRPAMVRAPGFALRLTLGEAAKSLLVSQRVRPARALAAGYRFRFPELRDALLDLFGPG